MRIAVVHHWFVTRGGGERVAECIAALFPAAEIFTLVAGRAGTPESLAGRNWHTSFLQRIPWARSHHRHFLPFYPSAVEALDLRGFDLVLSSDSGPVKGVRLDVGARHICYCHSPMRYLWDGYEQYRTSMGRVTSAAFALAAPRVRRWDREAAQRVTWFLANSRYVADRIERCYGRESEVIHPPIDLHRAPQMVDAGLASDAYLCAGRLVSYKRVDLLIEACRKLGRKLRIAGTGPELERLRAFATGDSNIVFLGELPTSQLWQEFARCRALLFAADEDFGMIPLEVQACGRPAIAFGAGGSLETISVPQTGMYFNEQSLESAAQAIIGWETEGEATFDPATAKEWAASFATPLFLERYRNFVLKNIPEAAPFCISPHEAMERLL